MKTRILASAAGLGIAASAAVAHADPVTWYIGGDVVQVETKVTDQTGVPPIITGSGKGTTLRVKGGMHILSWLDAEAQFILPKETTYSTTGGVNNTAETTVLALFAKPNLNLGPVNLYGLVGIGASHFDFKGVVSSSDSGKTMSDLAYGLGAQYKINRNFAVSLDWTHYGKKNFDLPGLPGGLDVEVNAVGLGVNYTF